MSKKHTIKILLPLLSLLVLLTFPTLSSAIELNVDYPTIPIPGGSIDLDCLEIGSCPAFTLGDLIIFIYAAAIWIGGLIAFISLGYAGFTWIFSGESPAARNKAKTWFTNVLWGLGILFLSYIFLVLINPDLINLDFNQQAAESGVRTDFGLPDDIVIKDTTFCDTWGTDVAGCSVSNTTFTCLDCCVDAAGTDVATKDQCIFDFIDVFIKDCLSDPVFSVENCRNSCATEIQTLSPRTTGEERALCQAVIDANIGGGTPNIDQTEYYALRAICDAPPNTLKPPPNGFFIEGPNKYISCFIGGADEGGLTGTWCSSCAAFEGVCKWHPFVGPPGPPAPLLTCGPMQPGVDWP